MRQTAETATQIIDKLFAEDSEYRDMINQEHRLCRIARAVYKMRAESGLTQRELAALLGTTREAIASLEDADHEARLRNLGENESPRGEAEAALTESVAGSPSPGDDDLILAR